MISIIILSEAYCIDGYDIISKIHTFNNISQMINKIIDSIDDILFSDYFFDLLSKHNDKLLNNKFINDKQYRIMNNKEKKINIKDLYEVCKIYNKYADNNYSKYSFAFKILKF